MDIPIKIDVLLDCISMILANFVHSKKKQDAVHFQQVIYYKSFKKIEILKFVFRLLAIAPVTEPILDLATKCDPANCELPYCFCSKDGTLIPGGLDPENVSFLNLKINYMI